MRSTITRPAARGAAVTCGAQRGGRPWLLSLYRAVTGGVVAAVLTIHWGVPVIRLLHEFRGVFVSYACRFAIGLCLLDMIARGRGPILHYHQSPLGTRELPGGAW